MSVLRHVLSVAAAAVLWGSAGVIGRLATDAGVTAVSVAASRLTIAAVALPPLTLALTRRRRAAAQPLGDVAAHVTGQVTAQATEVALAGAVRPRRKAGLIATGVLLALYQGAFFAAVDRTGVTVATLVALGCAPVLVAVAGPLVGDARADRRTWSGILAALVGLILLVGADPSAGASALVGVGLALLSGAGYAAIILLGRSLRHVDPLQVLAVGFPVGAVLLAPTLPGLATGSVRAGTWLSLLYLGLLPTALAYVLFLRGIAGLPAAVVSTVTLLEPATAAALAALVLGERIGLVGALGGVLVIVGVVLVTRR